ncbi:hypothetical protein HY285_05870 [Candidatus Peregrinibacteria bacterium]|nr:hypothetical protein [Candidatus Peregrinibacteria bacterium]MBI3817035.1 hypothetical protein [Candidatus Peregrinibacteria bacterium]
MITFRRFATAVCAVAVPLVLLLSIARAEETQSSSSSTSSTNFVKTDQCPLTSQQLSAAAHDCVTKDMGASVTRNATTGCEEFNGCVKSDQKETTTGTAPTSLPSCPMSPQDVSAKARACKAEGMGAKVTKDGVCYTSVSCVSGDHRKTTPTTAPTTTTPCPTSMQDVASKAQACKAQGMGVTVKKNGACYTFIGCVQRSETEHSQTTTSQPTGTCTETKEGGCTKIVCADGFRFNSCEMAAICKQMTTTAKPIPMPLPPVPSGTNTMKGPCSDSEAGLQYAYDKFLVNPGDANVQKVVNDLKTKLNDCRVRNAGQTTSPSATTNGTSASCTVAKNNDTGCMEKRCGNAVVAKSCPSSNSLSSVHS